MNVLKNFHMNTVARYSITKPFESSQVSKYISESIIQDLQKDPFTIVITDATACAGGDSIKFSKYFKHVNSVEIEKETFDLLEKNIEKFDIKNISVYNADFLNIYKDLKQDVIYIDAPWSGIFYKNKDSIKLKLSGIDLGLILERLFQHDKNVLIFLKVPFNVYTSDFQKYIQDSRIILNKFNKETFKILKCSRSF